MINFEAHVTVDPGQEQALRDAFPHIKVLSFRNNAPDGRHIADVMTSGTMSRSSLNEAVEEVDHLVQRISRRGIEVLRIKIEAEPWCRVPGLYLETHLRVMGGVAPPPHELVLWSRSWKYSWYATVRSRNTVFTAHTFSVGSVVTYLLGRGWQVVGDVEHELVVWDTNPDHDAAWEGR